MKGEKEASVTNEDNKRRRGDREKEEKERRQSHEVRK
jgi:hypothetical protein